MEQHSDQPPTPALIAGEIAALSPVRRALAWAEGHVGILADDTVRLTEIPAPTFAEADRAAFLAEQFRTLGLEQVEQDRCGNVYGLLPGDGQPAAAFLAHLDTVFPAHVPVKVTRRDGRLYGPGVGDNAAGIAGMLGMLRALQAAGLRPRRPVWLVGTVGEEGLGNLRGAAAATDRLGHEVDAIVAVEGSFYGRLSAEAVGSRRLEIVCRAQGGHSWHDFGRPGAVHSLIKLAAGITALPVPSEPRTTYNIGRIEGGVGVNVIAEEAKLLLDMRSADARALDHLTGQVKALAGRAATGVEFELREVGFRPAGSIAAEHPLVQLCAAVLNGLNVSPQCAPSSTDANIPLSRGIPAVTLGVTRGGGAHTRGEWIDIAPLARGVQQLILVALALGDPRAEGMIRRAGS